MATFKPLSTEKGSAVGSLPKEAGEGPIPPPSLHLTHEHLKTLGLKIPAVGDKLHITAHAVVHSTSENQDHGDGGKRAHVALHIHQMEVGTKGIDGAKEEDQKDGMKSEIDKALTKHAGSEAAKGKKPGKTPTPRGGEDDGS
jgi:hypothetical protein